LVDSTDGKIIGLLEKHELSRVLGHDFPPLTCNGLAVELKVELPEIYECCKRLSKKGLIGWDGKGLCLTP